MARLRTSRESPWRLLSLLWTVLVPLLLSVSCEPPASPREPVLRSIVEQIAVSDAAAVEQASRELTRAATQLAPGAPASLSRAVKRIGNRPNRRDALCDLPLQPASQLGVEAGDQRADTDPADRTRDTARVPTKTDVLNPEHVVRQILLRTIAETGVFVLLIARLVRHGQALAGEFRTAEQARGPPRALSALRNRRASPSSVRAAAGRGNTPWRPSASR